MKFTTVTIAYSAAAFVTASPCQPAPSSTPTSSIKDGDIFQLDAVGAHGLIQNTYFQAYDRGLNLDGRQGAPCTNNAGLSTSVNFAQFYLNNGTLFLSGRDQQAKKFFVDRSGMGQGVIQYTSGPANGRYFEISGWKTTPEGYLVFNGGGTAEDTSFQACPLNDGSFHIWLSAAGGEATNPAGNTDCFPIGAKINKITDESQYVVCQYSE